MNMDGVAMEEKYPQNAREIVQRLVKMKQFTKIGKTTLNSAQNASINSNHD